MASECGRDDVREARREWRTGRQPRMRREPHRLVFVDETATTTKMTRLRGRARRHLRLMARAPFGHWRTQTFVAALRCDGLSAPWIIDRQARSRRADRRPSSSSADGETPSVRADINYLPKADARSKLAENNTSLKEILESDPERE